VTTYVGVIIDYQITPLLPLNMTQSSLLLNFEFHTLLLYFFYIVGVIEIDNHD